jgi:hypothetical protein
MGIIGRKDVLGCPVSGDLGLGLGEVDRGRVGGGFGDGHVGRSRSLELAQSYRSAFQGHIYDFYLYG